LQIRAVQARAAIGDGYSHPPDFIDRAHDGQPATCERGRAHRIAGIDDQIEQHLLQLYAGAEHTWQIFLETRDHLDVVCNQIRMRELEDLMHEIAEVDGLPLRIALLV